MPARLPAGLLLLLGALAGGAAAGDASPAEQAERPLLRISRVEQLVALSDGVLGKAYALLGRVSLESRGLFSVRAERAVVWLDPDADAMLFRLFRELEKEDRGIPLWAVRAVYAEGTRVPAVFQTAGQIFRCSAFYYDFRRLRGILVDADLRLRRAERSGDAPDLVLRAHELRILGPGRIRARDVTLFSSSYHDDDVAVTMREVRVEDPVLSAALGRLERISARDYREGRGPTAAEVDGVLRDVAAAGADLGPKLVSLDGIRLRLYDVPVFGWDGVEAKGEDVMPLRFEASVGSIGDFGSGGRLAGGLATKPVGFLLGGGYIDDHGPFADLELDVDALGGRLRGKSWGSYLRDRGEEDGLPAPTEDRFWTQNLYRFEISRAWRLDAEYADLSDPLFLDDWNERVAKEGLPQETLAYLRGRGERGYVTLLYKWRTISFEDEVERVPALAGSLPVLTLLRLGEGARGEPLTLQVSLPAEVANLRHRQGRGFPLPDFRSVRATVDPTFHVSFDAGPFRVVPFTTLGVTAYESDLAGDAATRFTGSAGIRIDTQLARWFGRVRHVVNLSLSYEDLFAATVPPEDLFPFDAVDEVAPWEGLGLRWRNRLLRRTPEGLVEFLSAEVHGAWFPEGERPLGREGDWLVDWYMRWQATRTILVLSRGDVEEGVFETASGEAWWEARSNLGLGVGLRHLEGDSDILSLGAEIEVDTRWSIVGFSQYDLREGDESDQGVLIRRLGKSVAIGARLTYEPGDDGLGVSVTFDLLERYRERQRRRDTLRSLVGWN